MRPYFHANGLDLMVIPDYFWQSDGIIFPLTSLIYHCGWFDYTHQLRRDTPYHNK